MKPFSKCEYDIAYCMLEHWKRITPSHPSPPDDILDWEHFMEELEDPTNEEFGVFNVTGPQVIQIIKERRV